MRKILTKQIKIFEPNTEIFRWGPLLLKLFYASDFFNCVYSKFQENYPEFSWPKTLLLKNKRFWVWLNNFEDLRENGGRLFLERMLPKDKREESRQKWEENRQELIRLERKIEDTDLRSLSNENFIKLWKEFHNAVMNFWTHSLLPELSNYGSSEILEKKLKKFIKNEAELNSAMQVLTSPTGMSFYQEEEIDLDETKDLEEHRKKYFWLKNSYENEQVLDLDFFKERKKNLEKGVRKKINKLFENALKKKQELKEKYGLSKEIMDIADAISDAMVWQDARKKEIWIYIHYKELLLDEIVRRYGFEKKYLYNFESEEILELLGKKKDDKIFKSREEAYSFLSAEEIVSFDEKISLKYWDMYAQEKVDKNINEFKGTVVSKGNGKTINGIVKIVLDAHNISGFNEGDILVTTMTSPEFVFVMKKAGAVITDTGGLTSHAAIVSRELKKVCIVGTKVATQVLKNGDEVEVDVEKGVVRIMEKKK